MFLCDFFPFLLFREGLGITLVFQVGLWEVDEMVNPACNSTSLRVDDSLLPSRLNILHIEMKY